MESKKEAFIKLALDCHALKFGSFELKSGRISPYFFNAGLFYRGSALRDIGAYYAQTLIQAQIAFKHLFGPAYKGLPLATATAVALAEGGVDATVTFNRKETKDHGEGGLLIGAPLHGETVIIDDVITAGTAFREARELIKEAGGSLTAVVIALDRCERGQGRQSTLTEIKQQGIEVLSIVSFFDLVRYLKSQGQHQHVSAMLAYHEQYGVKPMQP